MKNSIITKQATFCDKTREGVDFDISSPTDEIIRAYVKDNFKLTND